MSICRHLLGELDNWKKNLPSYLEFVEETVAYVYPSHLRQIIMMYVRYQYARILLSRPFLIKSLHMSRGPDAHVAADPRIIKYKDLCFQSAVDAWNHILSLWKRGQYNGNLRLDGVFAYQFNLILALYLLDTSVPSDSSRSQKIQKMIRHIQDILLKEPGNRTIGRLIQISRDFSAIVSPDQMEERENTDAFGQF